MSKSEQHYESDPVRRTLQKIKEFASKSKGENNCCVHDPLINIPLDHIILDELHLLLRISDILIDNIVQDAMQWYDKETWITGKKKVHLDRLIQAINSCGVSFLFLEK